jgi:hypothetical protein
VHNFAFLRIKIQLRFDEETVAKKILQLHSFNYAASESRSNWSDSDSSGDEILVHSFVSSANIFMSFTIQFGSSLTKIRKSRGSSIDPCGTPLRTFNHFENDPLTPTLSDLPVRNDSSHCRSFPLIPDSFNLSKSLLCETLSKAFR